MAKETHTEIDERWIGEWVTRGLKEIEHLLARHAAFLTYCRSGLSDTEEGT